jgi:hypothetical protein
MASPIIIYISGSAYHRLMSNWYFRTVRLDDMSRIVTTVQGGKTLVRHVGTDGTTVEVAHIKGFVKAMTLLSKHLNRPVIVRTEGDSSQRGRDLCGTYDASRPPVVAQRIPAGVWAQAHVEYRARAAGESTRTAFGYCETADCGRVAVGVFATVQGRYTIACAPCSTINAGREGIINPAYVGATTEAIEETVARIRALRNLTTPLTIGAAVTLYAMDKAAILAARANGLVIMTDGILSVPGIAEDITEAVHVGGFRKFKSTSRNRRYRKGA